MATSGTGACRFGVVVRFTHCLDVDGFPRLLQYMLKEQDFLYLPEYTVYLQAAPYGLDNFVVEIRIWARAIDIESSWTFHCYGSTPEAATQSTACHALLRMRMEARTHGQLHLSLLPCSYGGMSYSRYHPFGVRRIPLAVSGLLAWSQPWRPPTV